MFDLFQLLSSTGLFEHTEDEITVWLRHLTDMDVNHQVALTVLEKSLGEVMKDPYTYTEKVAELVSEATALDRDADSADVVSIGTNNALLDGMDCIYSITPCY